MKYKYLEKINLNKTLFIKKELINFQQYFLSTRYQRETTSEIPTTPTACFTFEKKKFAKARQINICIAQASAHSLAKT